MTKIQFSQTPSKVAAKIEEIVNCATEYRYRIKGHMFFDLGYSLLSFLDLEEAS